MTVNSNPIRVLLVDDNLTILWGLGKLIQSEWPRMSLLGKAHTVSEALLQARARPHVILLDLDLAGCSSVEILPELMHSSKGRVLIYTGMRDRRLHEDAMLLGARGVLKKGESADVILQAIDHVHAGGIWKLSPDGDLDRRRQLRLASDRETEDRIATLTSADRRIIDGVVARWRAMHAPNGKHLLGDAPPLTELASIYSKLGVRNRAELIAFATRYRLATPPEPQWYGDLT